MELKIFLPRPTGEFHRLGRCFLDWATAVVGEADRELTCVTLIYHSSGPIYEISRYFAMLSMQHEGHGKAAKVDENVSQWTKICRSTVNSSIENLSKELALHNSIAVDA